MRTVLVALGFAAFTPLAAFAQLPPPATIKVDYERDVKPILLENCYSCHGEDVQQSGLRLDLRQNALRGGDYGPVILAGKSAESKLIKRLVDGDGGMQMPPSGPLSPEQIGILRAWIDQGPEFRTDVSAARPARETDPKVATLIAAVRNESAEAVRKAFAGQMDLVNSRDRAGSTPLHHAAGFGSLDTMTWLLDEKAEAAATNRLRSTPLHWAIHDEAKVRLLLSRGAAVNARQVNGRTPLYLAATIAEGLPVVRLLLAHGADPNIATTTGQTPLMTAAVRGNVDALKVLIEHKASVNATNGAGETALMLAASDGNPRAIALLLEHGADARVRSKRNETALGNAGTAGNEAAVRLLLDAGAEVNTRNIRGFSPLMLAASSDAAPAGIVRLLLEKGADTTFTGDYDETARDLAAKRGNTEVTRLLGGMPAGISSLAVTHTAAVEARQPVIADAIGKAMTQLEKQSQNFIRIGGCNSCHSQDLPSAAAAVARRRGLSAPREFPQLPDAMTAPPERIMDLNFVAITGLAWEVFDLAMNDAPRTAFTDAAVRAIKAMQTRDGNWSSGESRRPPMNAGDFQATALAVYGLKHYGPPAEQATTDSAIAKARAWFATATPTTTQDRAFHLLGLAWTGSPAEQIAAAAKTLIAEQRSDGGWSQLPLTDSDAYATGEVLYALNASGHTRASDPVYKGGIAYLLRTQAPDGTWRVRSRSIWLQPYFESGFPYGQDQFISTAGTAWATMALSLAIEQPATSAGAPR